MVITPVLNKSVIRNVLADVIGSGSSAVSRVAFEFGYKVLELAGGGGYASSEVWVIDPADANPPNNLLPSFRHTAGANDSLETVTIGSLLSQEELDQGRRPIAQIGLYRADTDELVHSVEFRGREEVGYFWNELEFVVDLIEGVTYYFGTAVNGWTDWPEFNPDDGSSIAYTLTETQVLEGIAGLASRTSSWMVPVYFTGKTPA